MKGVYTCQKKGNRKQEKKRRNSRPKLRYILSFLAFMFCFLFTLKIHDIKAASYAKVINVKLKDGQDATTEIQKALDEAAKAGTKKKQAMVKVPAGTYYLSKSLVHRLQGARSWHRRASCRPR